MRATVRRFRWAIVAVVAVVLLGLIAGRPATSKPALDPDSTAPDGTKALVLLLRGLGADVSVGPSVPTGPGTALVLEDQLNVSDTNALTGWVRAGNTLVVADPTSQLAGVSEDQSFVDSLRLENGQTLDLEGCPIAPLASVAAVQPAGGVLLQPQAGDAACFGLDGGDYVLAHSLGSGTVVSLGGPGIWTNANLDRSDNSVLAAALLAPSTPIRVTIVGASHIGAGQSGLLALISPRLKEVFWQLVIAFFLLILWKGRRLGRPVAETLPVEIPGSELVVATGHLMRDGGHRGRAAQIMRRELGRTVRRRLGIPRSADPATVAAVAADRIGVSESVMVDALAGPEPPSDRELVRLAETIESIGREVSSAG